MTRRPNRKTAESASSGAPKRESVQTTARSLKDSLLSTEKGLASFELSLRRAGMAEAADGYRQLQAVLIQQRLWARRLGRVELDPQFHAVACRAAAIHGMLEPYVSAMAPLRALDRLELADAAGPAGDPQPRSADSVEARVVAALLSLGGAGCGRLAKASGCGPDQVQAVLDRLCHRGLLERRGWGRGVGYHFSAQAREVTACKLLAETEEDNG